MNHQLYETWLLEDQALNAEQRRELILHVRECRTCAALEYSNFALRATPAIPATAGFTNRFQARLVRQRAIERRKILINTTLLSIAAISLLILWIYPYIPFLMHASPEHILSAWTESLTWIGTAVRTSGIIARTVFNLTFTFAPGYVEMLGFTFIISLTAVWVSSVQKVRARANSTE